MRSKHRSESVIAKGSKAIVIELTVADVADIGFQRARTSRAATGDASVTGYNPNRREAHVSVCSWIVNVPTEASTMAPSSSLLPASRSIDQT